MHDALLGLVPEGIRRHVERTERGVEERIGGSMATRVRRAVK